MANSIVAPSNPEYGLLQRDRPVPGADEDDPKWPVRAGKSEEDLGLLWGPKPDFLLGAARPLPLSTDIDPGGQSVGQAAQRGQATHRPDPLR